MILDFLCTERSDGFDARYRPYSMRRNSREYDDADRTMRCSPSLPDLILHAEDLLRNDPGQLSAVYSHHESSP